MQITSPNFISKWNYSKTARISGMILALGLFFGILSPKLFEQLVKSQLNLTPNSELRELYVKVPFFLSFKVYMFNLTNPEEFAQGGKAKLQEVGPYFFEEWKEKFDLVDDEAEDTLRYHFKNTFKFRPDLSGGLTGNEIITMPHPLLATMMLTLKVDERPILPLITTAVDIIFNSPKDMFWTGRVMDALFDGIPVDCSKTENFRVKTVCDILKSGEVKELQPHNATHLKFSFLKATNAADLGEFMVFRGKKNSVDVGRVAAFNSNPESNVWNGDECNQYVGTDSTIFPPYMDVYDGIWAWEPTVCRSIGAHYVKKLNYMGIETAEFAVDLSSAENAKKCFCHKQDACPKKGTFDLFPCVGAPMIGSQPHFYGADPSLLDHFESGLHPNKEDHAMHMHFEMTTGTPLKAAKRLQFNLQMVPVEKIPYMADLREMYYPLFWVEEGVALNETFVNQIKYTVVLGIQIQSFLKWTCLIVGGFGLLVSTVLVLFKFATDSKSKQSASQSSKNKNVA